MNNLDRLRSLLERINAYANEWGEDLAGEIGPDAIAALEIIDQMIRDDVARELRARS